MNRKSTDKKDYKVDFQVRSEGYYQGPEIVIFPSKSPSVEAQAALGPVPSGSLTHSMFAQVGVSFHYDVVDTTYLPRLLQHTFNANYSFGFSYDGGYDGTISDQTDTLTPIHGLTLAYA
jgi:hypothetical protein